MYQILSGIEELHDNRIFHRDMKPHNILINSNNQIKIADFGLARNYTIPDRQYTQDVVTLWYRAPEILLSNYYFIFILILDSEYSIPVDIWSVGCIFYELLTKQPLFRGDSVPDQLTKIFRLMGLPKPHEWEEIYKNKDFQ